MSRTIIRNTYLVTQGIFDRSLMSHIFLNTFNVQIHLLMIRKNYTLFINYILKVGINGTIPVNLKVKINC